MLVLLLDLLVERSLQLLQALLQYSVDSLLALPLLLLLHHLTSLLLRNLMDRVPCHQLLLQLWIDLLIVQVRLLSQLLQLHVFHIFSNLMLLVCRHYDVHPRRESKEVRSVEAKEGFDVVCADIFQVLQAEHKYAVRGTFFLLQSTDRASGALGCFETPRRSGPSPISSPKTS